MLENPVDPTDDSEWNGIDLSVVPLQALSSRTRGLVAQLLNQERVFKSENEDFRDWRGVFNVIGIPQSNFQPVSNKSNPTKHLLELWQSEADQCERLPNLAELQCVLGIIDRWDILDDTSKMFEQDAIQFIMREHTQSAPNVSVNADLDIITRDDTIHHKQKYDALILSTHANIVFASKVIDKMEARRLLLCVPDRDILGGSSFKHDVISRLIKRCRRVVVIFSKAFLESPLNDFIITYAQALQINERSRKVIPCLYEQCELPPLFQHIWALDYEQSLQLQKFYNFWDKLAEAIRETPPRRIGTEKVVEQSLEQRLHEVPSNLEEISVPQPVPKVVVDQQPKPAQFHSVEGERGWTSSSSPLVVNIPPSPVFKHESHASNGFLRRLLNGWKKTLWHLGVARCS